MQIAIEIVELWDAISSPVEQGVGVEQQVLNPCNKDICWLSLFPNLASLWTLHITIDHTDFIMKEPALFSPSWYSHKQYWTWIERYDVGIWIDCETGALRDARQFSW